MRLNAKQAPDSLNFVVLFIQLKSHFPGNGRHLYSYPLLQASLRVLQFSFFNLIEAKERFSTGFIEGDQHA
jgi:hypothetical protein